MFSYFRYGLAVVTLYAAMTMVGCQSIHQASAYNQRAAQLSSLKPAPAHHLQHDEIYGESVTGYNSAVLQAIDKVQAHEMDGGGYFIGIFAKPTESPVGYALTLGDYALLDPPRSTSYCSGASYAVFIEALNIICGDKLHKLDDARKESLRMQEPDGGRREDGVKFWGHFNDDGYGSQFALVQYSKMGAEVLPDQAMPGDFCNISWASGVGHSVVFLGWFTDPISNQKYMRYWSSQKGTNGFGDQSVSIKRIKAVKFVRLTNPDSLFSFDTKTKVIRKVPGDFIKP